MMTASQITIADVVTIRGFASVSDAVALMKEKGLRAPAIEDGLLGMISITDILRTSDSVEKPKSNFDLYCDENPNAPEARMYDD